MPSLNLIMNPYENIFFICRSLSANLIPFDLFLFYKIYSLGRLTREQVKGVHNHLYHLWINCDSYRQIKWNAINFVSSDFFCLLSVISTVMIIITQCQEAIKNFYLKINIFIIYQWNICGIRHILLGVLLSLVIIFLYPKIPSTAKAVVDIVIPHTSFIYGKVSFENPQDTDSPITTP